ncbi:MAG: O-antigen ligase family protein [Patescibacteria group bacterium]
MKKTILNIFFSLLLLSLLTPFWVFSQLQFPFITSKAFFFRICVELALPFYLYLAIADKQLRPNLKNPFNLAVLVFLFFSIISAVFGLNVSRSLWGNFERMGGVYYLAHLVAVFFYLQLLGKANSLYLKIFLQSFIVVASVLSLNGLSSWLGGPAFVMDPSLPERSSSTFGNPIFFASYLIIPLFLAVYLAMQEKQRIARVFYWIAVALQLGGLYSSVTRGATVGIAAGLLAGLVIYVFLSENRKLKKYGIVLIGLFLALIIGIFLIRNKLSSDSALYSLTKLKDSNTEARLIQWGVALKGYKDHPIIGVGPENYNIIFAKYFDPKLYQYDPSWFDKPHNYLLEILTTGGAVGFVAYLSSFGLAIYACWKAYKRELLSAMEFSILVAGLIAYQAQNMFVFDTVSASVAYFVFLGFLAYMWGEVSDLEQVAKVENRYAAPAFYICLPLVLVLIYISNIASIQAAKRVNMGYSYTEYDPKTAAGYFESALATPFNLDKQETANRYSDFASKLLFLQNPEISEDFIKEQADKATANQKKITESVGNDPLLWMRLVIGEMNQALVYKKNVNNAQGSMDKALASAPKRVEILQLQLQLYGTNKQWTDSLHVAKKIVGYNPYKPELKWQLAMSYFLNDQIEEAIKAGDEAVAQGFKFNKLQQFAWYIQYYEDQKNYAKVAPLLEQAIALEPNEIGLYVDLAKVYANLGNYEKARLLAQQVAQADPSQKAAMDVFIKSLK